MARTFPNSVVNTRRPTEYYRYRVLGFQQIRLLQILQGRSGHGVKGQLEVALTQYNLVERTFDTLSYTWGSSTLEEKDAANDQILNTAKRCCPVVCEGNIIGLFRSLRNALYQLRNSSMPRRAAVYNRVLGPDLHGGTPLYVGRRDLHQSEQSPRTRRASCPDGGALFDRQHGCGMCWRNGPRTMPQPERHPRGLTFSSAYHSALS
jgi:hypothetical protein